MNVRSSLITAAALLALAAPTAQAAGRHIPDEAVGSAIETVRLHAAQATIHPSAKLPHGTHKSVAAKWGTCNPYAYVPGGSSPRVSKAITDAVVRTCRP